MEAFRYQCFSTVYALRGSVSPYDGYRHYPISVATSLDSLQESTSCEYPSHVMVVSRVVEEGFPLLNQPYVFGGHPEGERGVIQDGGD